MTQVIFSGRSFKWINTVIDAGQSGRDLRRQETRSRTRERGTCNGHINIVVGPADSTADPAILSRARIARWNQGCAVFRVSLMATKPRDENYRPKENDRCVYQPGGVVPQRRQT